MSRRGRGHEGRSRADDGQSAVELALVLPLLVALMFAVAQIGLVVRAQIMVLHAAREAVRVVAVNPDADAEGAALSAAQLDAARTTVIVAGDTAPGGLVTVEVSYDVATDVPIVGPLFGDVQVSGDATMMVEGQPE